MSHATTTSNPELGSCATAATFGSNNPSRLPSPPVSPDRGKTPLSRPIESATDGKENQETSEIPEREPEKPYESKFSTVMTVTAHRPGSIKSDCLAFLKSYQARVGTQHDGSKRKYSPRVMKPTHTPISSRGRSYNSEEDATAASTSTNNGNYVLSSSHTYSTRSRKGRNSPEAIYGSKSSATESVPRTLAGVSRADFLKACDVHMIHDMEINQVPNFTPSMDHITSEQVEKQIRRIGFSLTHALKDTTHLEEVPQSEITLVTAFKLTPLQYLENKKRFFAEKARKTQLGTTFKKTDAQKACAIDVNKASKLYEVFDHMGLLKDSLFSGL